MTSAHADRAAGAPRLVGAATDYRAWYQATARELVAPGDQLGAAHRR